MSEKEIKNEIKDWLDLQRIYYWVNVVAKVPGHRGRMKRGVFDILGCYNGKLLAIEVKSENGIVSKEQREFMYNVKLHGGIAFIARSLQDVIDVLKHQSMDKK